MINKDDELFNAKASAATPFSVRVLSDVKIDGGEVFRLERSGATIKMPSEVFAEALGQTADPGPYPQILMKAVEFSHHAGFTAFTLDIENTPNFGATESVSLNIFGGLPLTAVATRFDRKPGSANRANVFFQNGAAPLFPVANRLRDDADSGTGRIATVSAKILGVPVNAPRNGDGCHLHGLTYDKKPSQVQIYLDEVSATAEATFDSNIFAGDWIGSSSLKVSHCLRENAYEFRMRAHNTGDVGVPMGMGAHPYLKAPSGNFKAVSLRVPGAEIVEIDNYKNVLPTGKIIQVPAELDFRSERGRAVNGRYLDNLWVNLEKDRYGFAFTELFDEESRIKIKLTALTINVIGVQAYCPEKSAVVALELVTHLPDPRDALWGRTDTGMRLVQPGGELEYGYKIEVSRF